MREEIKELWRIEAESHWRRFELLVQTEKQNEELERVLNEKDLSRQDIAIILLGLRVRPEFGRSSFGIE